MSVWIGRFDKEGGGQSEAAWTRNESSPAGVIGWSGPPRGALALFLSCSPSYTCSLLLWLAPLFRACGSLRVPGEQNCRGSRCRGPIGTAKVQKFRWVFQQTDRRMQKHETEICIPGVCICEFVSLKGRKKKEFV